MEHGLSHLSLTSGTGPSCSVLKPRWGSCRASSVDLTHDCQLGLSDENRSPDSLNWAPALFEHHMIRGSHTYRRHLVYACRHER